MGAAPSLRIGYGAKPYTLRAATGVYNYYVVAAPMTTTASSGGGTTLKQDTAFTFNATGLGTKSISVTPSVWDDGRDAAYGSTSSQWTASNSKLPVAAGGIYNIQNQPPGFAPSGSYVAPVNPFVKAVIAGCHLSLGVNDSNSVMLGYAWTPPNNGTTTTYPFSSRHEYDVYYDRNMFWNPQSDGNDKQNAWGDGNQVFPSSGIYAYWEPGPITLFPIDSISQANPCVIHSPWNSAVAPCAAGDVISIFGVIGMTQINGLALTVASCTGNGSNWTITTTLDSSAFSAYGGPFTVSAATNASTMNITIPTVSGSNPLTSRTFIWATGALGGTWASNFNHLVACCAVNPSGVSGAWTADVINGQFTGTPVNSSGWGTYTANSASVSVGAFSNPFANATPGGSGTAVANNHWQNTRGMALNPVTGTNDPGGFMQNPDAAGVNMSSLIAAPMPASPASGIVRVRIEYCWTTSTALTPGYIRVYYNNVLTKNFVGRTDTLTPQTLIRNFAMGSTYQSSRGPNNFCYYYNPYYDVSSAANCAVLYLCNANTLAASTIAEPQPHLLTWTSTQITGNKLNQGKHANGATVYLIALTESGAEVTDGVTYTITPTFTPTITTSSLPGATHGSAYSQAITATGGTTAYTFYLASSNTGAAPCVNTWAVNSSTGQVTGTPTTAGTDQIVVTCIDANGYNGSKQFSIVVS